MALSSDAAPKRGPRRRELILEAAADLFHERGYDATGIDEIGRAAGISGPGVYRHFASKEEILETLVHERGTASLDLIQGIVEASEDPQTLLEQLIDTYVTTIMDHRQVSVISVYERRMLTTTTRAWIERSERLLVAEWVHALTIVRPGLNDSDAHFMVRAALNMVIAAFNHHSGLSDETLGTLLRGMLRTALGLDAGT